ncbi:uncharacterized protein LOC131206698 isoform X2 [Anopheles bellator]|uniref:uncharacterized protein LOC131206698 isoform X2 n=1 Tax=Anopheles bellator TaxID=139047 RepID=UPI002647D274|nr:uncharacterized protein LOC131206698 isoform X2 [Anopheles bellator]
MNTSKMNGEQKNESFKLLQLSEDSKSLSDLELPEVQRKRKVRRKTRHRTSSYRGDDEHVSAPPGRAGHVDCRNLSIWLAVAMTVLWLFIISYVTSVIHGENRRLELALQKVSATSQNVPEALQKWHETSKNLEQNQTALNGKLREMQQVLSNFFNELKELRESMDKKNENSQKAQLNALQSSVADLGSNIGESKSRITELETRFVSIQTEQKQLNKTLDELQTLFGRIQNTTAVSEIMGAGGTQDVEKKIVDLRDQLTDQLNKLAANVSSELQALHQKNVWLDNDLTNHTQRIDRLFDNTANISSVVSSIEAVWWEIRNNMSSLEADRKALNDQLAALANVTTGLHGTIAKVQEECQQYHSKLDGVNGKLGALQDQIQQVETKEAIHRSREANNTQKQIAQENLPPDLSNFFAEQIASENKPVTPKPSVPSATAASASQAFLYAGTLVTQMSTTPQPAGTTAAAASIKATATSTTGTKKAVAPFDSVM